MKKTFSVKSLLVSMAIASSAALSVAPATTQAGVSGNLGAVTTYVYRGIKQTDAAGQGGIDYESDSGLYAGTWLSNVGTGHDGNEDGIEYDLYGGWGGSFGGVDLGIGYIGYFYTNGFDSMYNELNLSVGFGGVTLAFNPGIYDAENSDGDSTTNYYNVNVSGDVGPISLELGYNDWDTSYDKGDGVSKNTYLNVTYSRELFKGVDGSITYTGSYANLQSADYPSGEYEVQSYLIVGISTSFDIK
ncbi:TorF family putative porin [Hydrogenovibrio thermophilus]|jgi:uncharacterized protein (TIGR02001 family)|uniref:Histidine kinase n=1 Tax=Hydrogenovibrio thermophilus TaxID=265883 RepID=A0A451G5B7_9GAMM|nr:TorF family putative porin [Hydrogenovibrio thermophilus]QAB14698.1 hypothetical protein EPV75_02935 [Hydrogenovibrio thermophilus]